MARVLGVILAVADTSRSAAGRVGLLLGGAVEALMPCLGLPKPEVIRSALEVLCIMDTGAAQHFFLVVFFVLFVSVGLVTAF